MAIPLPPKVMLEKALCHQSLEQDDDAVAYMEMIWQRIRDAKHLNADEKAYIFLYTLKRAEPYSLTVKSIPPAFETFRLEQVSTRLQREFPIPELTGH